MGFFRFLGFFWDFFCTFHLARTARSARRVARVARRALFENWTTSFPLFQSTFEHPPKTHLCHPDYGQKNAKHITRMVLKWKKNKKYQKNEKRTGPSPPRNEGEKTTVNRKLLWSRQNKRLPESLQKWGWRKEGDQGKLKERGKVMKTRPIRPKKSIKNSRLKRFGPPAHPVVPK